MKRLNILLFITLSFYIKAGAQGINFENKLSWEEVKLKAKNENKFIFLDIYATWCGPCKIMNKEVFSKKETGDLINSKFVAVKVQTDSTNVDSEYIISWRSDAAKIKKEFQIRAYPTYIFLAPNGQIVHMVTGSMPETVFLAESQRALNPEEQYNNLISRYNSGMRDPEFIRYLTKRAEEVGQKTLARKIAIEYIESLSDQDLYKPENIRFVYFNTKSSADRGFSFFLKNVDKITKVDSSWKVRYIKGLTAKIIIEEEVAPYFRDCNGKPDWKIVRNKLVSKYGKVGEEIWQTDRSRWIFKYEVTPILKSNPSVAGIEAEFEKHRTNVGEENLLGSTVLYYLNSSGEPNSDLKNICDRVVYFWNSYVERFPERISVGTMNQQAWFIFESSDDKNHLLSALKWAKKGVDISPPTISSNIRANSGVIDTYANLLYKLGKVKEAIEWEEKAVRLMPDSFDYTEALRKMRAGLPTWKTENSK